MMKSLSIEIEWWNSSYENELLNNNANFVNDNANLLNIIDDNPYRLHTFKKYALLSKLKLKALKTKYKIDNWIVARDWIHFWHCKQVFNLMT